MARKQPFELLLMGHSPKLQTILEAARKRFRAGAGIPHESFWKEIETENAARIKQRTRFIARKQPHSVSHGRTRV